MLVSVISTRFSDSIHAANFSAPSSSSFCLVPGGGGVSAARGSRGNTGCFGLARPLTSGLPLTITSPMKLNNRVARSRLRGMRNSSGVWSMNFVV